MCAAVPTLKASSDFQRISKQGRRWHAPAFVMLVAPGETFRLGLTASRKVGNAIVRNRAKRRLREAVRTLDIALPPVDMVLIARTSAAEYDFTRLKDDIIKGLKETKALA